MMKSSRIAIVFYSMLITFIALIEILILAFSGDTRMDAVRQLISITFLGVPILIYAISFSFIIGILIYLLVIWLERNNDKQIEQNLRYLVRGEYDEAIQFEMTEGSLLSANVQIHQNIHLLAEKLRTMSEQMQQLNMKAVGETAQTREEILKQERTRLSRELHDSVSQQLFAAMMILSGLNEQAQKGVIADPFAKQLSTVTEVINTAQSEMRALLLHLRPIELAGKSLRQGIEQLLRELETKINIKLTWDIEDVVLQESVENHLFRIMQELLSNTLRHAKASELEVYLHKINSIVTLQVIDDGIGFDVSQEKSASYGLKTMRERITAMGGEVKIVSLKGQGTSVEIKVPIV